MYMYRAHPWGRKDKNHQPHHQPWLASKMPAAPATRPVSAAAPALIGFDACWRLSVVVDDAGAGAGAADDDEPESGTSETCERPPGAGAGAGADEPDCCWRRASSSVWRPTTI